MMTSPLSGYNNWINVKTTFYSVFIFSFFLVFYCSAQQANGNFKHKLKKWSGKELAEQVVIKRTDYGVPHIEAENIIAAGFAMGYVQMQDYGKTVSDGLINARGVWAKYHDIYDREKLNRAIDRDAVHQRDYARAIETWHLLSTDTRKMLEGFAKGVNYYIKLHPEEFIRGSVPFFTGYDVLAREIRRPSYSSIQSFLKALKVRRDNNRDSATTTALASQPVTLLARVALSTSKDANPDVGSNAWAFAPSRTASGNAILLRNPHLSWSAGYYEAHVKVPGKLDFYGDFRIGGPFRTIGGFNRYLGWSTTNNYPQLDEIYAFDVDPQKPDHYMLDGVSIPVQRETIAVAFKNGKGTGLEHREFLSTPYGPVIYRGGGKIYVIHAADDGDYRSPEQWMRMMKAKNLNEWKAAMRMLAKPSSNFTYADVEGNIFYVWNAALPRYKQVSGGDTLAIQVTSSGQIWDEIVPFDSLPQLLNPQGGYLHNTNDPFYYTNLNEIFTVEDFADYPFYYPAPAYGLRSQESYRLIHDAKEKLSLKDVINLKFKENMLLADRVKGDLVTAISNTNPQGETAKALNLIKQWNNTASRDSRGSVLFVTWWDRYVQTADTGRVSGSPESAGFPATADKLFSVVWSPEQPVTTPRGLADPKRAVETFKWAMDETKEEYGAWNVSWGQVHRAIIGDVNVPVGGCSGRLGCFRVLWYSKDEVNGKKVLRARGGDGWVLAIEFSEVPRAYSVLAYGESDKEKSPYHSDQLALFADHKMKAVAFTEKDIQKQLIKAYHPGAEK